MSRLDYCKFSNEDLEEAGACSREYRRRHGLSRAQLATLLDTQTQRVTDLEKGRDPGSARLVAAIQDLLRDNSEPEELDFDEA
jgi:transcriptional regulator with XRE-family HTH domain